MRKIKSFKVFNSVESRLRVFESFDDALDILPVVKDMLLELSDLDYTTNCVIRRGDGKEYIRIGISKPAISHDRYNIKASFEWVDIKEIMNTIIEYLVSEGYHYRRDKGTLSEGGQPIIITVGNAYSGINSRCEMWFEI
jgi:hypothetical protein